MDTKIKFGTGGWRAVIGEDFTRKNVKRIANGIAKLIEKEGKKHVPVIIGYDRRFLSDNAARWIAEVLAAHGISVYFLHRSAPTPLIMHTVKDNVIKLRTEIHFSVLFLCLFSKTLLS